MLEIFIILLCLILIISMLGGTVTTPLGPPPLNAIPMTNYAPAHAPSSSPSKPMSANGSGSANGSANKNDSSSFPSPSPSMPQNPNHAGPAIFEHFGFGTGPSSSPSFSASNPSPTDFLTPYPINSSSLPSPSPFVAPAPSSYASQISNTMSNAMSSMSNAISLSPEKLMQSYSSTTPSPPGSSISTSIEPFDPMAFCSMTAVC